MKNKKLPIGYWLKQLDQLLTEGINNIQSQFGLTRSGWQVLNYISKQSRTEKEMLLATMSPFMESKKTEEIISQLNKDGLINLDNKFLRLTEKGETKHANCLKQQKEFRQTVTKDIKEEEYQKTVQTLQKMVENIKG